MGRHFIRCARQVGQGAGTGLQCASIFARCSPRDDSFLLKENLSFPGPHKYLIVSLQTKRQIFPMR